MPPKESERAAVKVLIVDDDRDFCWATGNVLKAKGYEVIHAREGEEGLKKLQKDIPDLILLDYRMPGRNGIQVAADMTRLVSGIPIIMITGHGDIKSAVKALKAGCYDYITKPVDNNDLLFTVERALEKNALAREVTRLKTLLKKTNTLYELMGKSDSIKNLIRLVEIVAPSQFTVLIEGESGSGKEIVARAIHDLSEKKKGPFVAVDCGAIPENLIESELFGYIKGAFTGAYLDKPGRFELADNGTLFLDEIGNLPHAAQQKLLRVIQDRSVQRLGDKRLRRIQVRLIAATNQILEKDIKSGVFRSDLYFRLKEFSIKVPPLRERKDTLFT